MASFIRALSQHEQINFLLSNRIPRRLVTHLMGWLSRIENPVLAEFLIRGWKFFADDLDFEESKKDRFNSLHDCFIRELKEGARPIDPQEDVVTSPCDAVIGCSGKIDGTTIYQAKGFPYELSDLMPNATHQEKYHNGTYVTLRLKSSMYHRFHAPLDCNIRQVTYISGDTWNVNPIALKRIKKLFCKNERAVIELLLDGNGSIILVPVAAILVASMKFHCLPHSLDLAYDGPNLLPCDASYKKGEEMGYFQHGSTIILFATPEFKICDHLRIGEVIRMGRPLLTRNTSNKINETNCAKSTL